MNKKKWFELRCPKGKKTDKNPSKYCKDRQKTVNSKFCRNNCSDYKKNDCEVWK